MPDARSCIRIYYLASPLFFALDAAFGANLRVAALEGAPLWKGAWYALCLACGAAVWLRWAWADALALLESGANVILLILSILLPYFAFADAVASGLPVANPLTLERVANFALAAPAALLSFRYSAAPWRGSTITT